MFPVIRGRLTGMIIVGVFVVAGSLLLYQGRAATPAISSQAESGTVASPASIKSDTTASDGRHVQFGPQPVSANASFYISYEQALSLPKSGTGYNNAKGIADAVKAGTLVPNLNDVNNRVGAVSLTAATFWLAGWLAISRIPSCSMT